MSETIFKLHQRKPYDAELHVNKIYITHVLELYTKHQDTYIYINAISITYIKKVFLT